MTSAQRTWIAVAIVLVALAAVMALALYLLRTPDRAAEAVRAEVGEALEPTTHNVTAGSEGAETIEFEAADLMFTGSSALGEQPGFFERVSGEIVLDAAGGPVALRGRVDMASLLTNSDNLTNNLKNEPGFFEVQKYPTAEFVSTRLTPASGAAAAGGASHEIEGNLTLRGITRSIKFPARIEVSPGQVSLSSEFSVDRQWFGVSYEGGAAFPEIRDMVLINLNLEVPRTAPDEASSNPLQEHEPTTRPAE